MEKEKKRQKITSVGKDVEKVELSYIIDRFAKWCNHLENNVSVPPNVKQSYHKTQQFHA